MFNMRPTNTRYDDDIILLHNDVYTIIQTPI